ncbi:YezD family protein [Methyloglobulus sp.]|uniref:YezD family protein n=1 Tax=Methyloglobulus sp. TaxID=2518622 RepID=UPI0032B7D95D
MTTIEKNYFSKESRINDINEQIAQAVNGIRFGSVEIIIHDGKVVQIERKEKLRFDRRSALDKNTKY